LKKIFLLLVTALFLLSLYGCNTSSSSNNSTEQTTVTNTDDLSLDSDIETTELNHNLEIYNNGKKVDTLNLYGLFKQIDNGFIYSKINKDSPNEMEYYRYYLDKKNSVKLGSIKNWSMQIHDKAYVNNHLCFTASTGDITDEENRTLEFIDIDLNKNKMTTVFSDKGGFPYDTVTGADNLVIITKVLDNGTSLELYDTETQKFKQLKYLEFDDKNSIGETIRKVSIDKSTKTISLLVLDCISQNEASLKIETYDYDMNFLKSYDISNISDDSNELIQGVQFFDFRNNYLIYQNFSMTRCIGYIGNKKLQKSDMIDNIDDTYSMAQTPQKGYNTVLSFKDVDLERNIYLFNTIDKTMKKTKFKPEEENYYIGSMSRTGKDNLMIITTPDNADKKSNLNPKLYFTKLSDLNFQ
jgi:hypothetical protein